MLAVLFAFAAAPAWAGSATFSPNPTKPGSTVTMTVTCNDSSDTVTFTGDDDVFLNGGSFPSVAQGPITMTVKKTAKPGTYKVAGVTCRSGSVGSAPGTVTESFSPSLTLKWRTTTTTTTASPSAPPAQATATTNGARLPFTGVPVAVELLAGVVLLGLGTLLVVTRRA